MTLGAALAFLIAVPAKAQTRANDIRMKTGNEIITDEVTYNFYDSGGPNIVDPEDDPNNLVNWVSMYQHNESYLLHLIKPAGFDTKGIKVTFNYLLINDDHLKIYEGDSEDPDNLIVDLTNNDYFTGYASGYTVISHGNMTLRFESNGSYRDLGWDASVVLYNYTPQAPAALMEACDNKVVLLPGSMSANGAANTMMVYTTDGTVPSINATTGSIINGTEYTAPIEITEVSTTVKAILVENGTTSSTVSTYTFSTLITPPATPTITHVEGTNDFEIDAHWNSGLRDTYYIQYTTNGDDPQFAPANQQLVCSEKLSDGTYVNKINTVTMDHTGTLRVVTRGTTCTELFSEEASVDVNEIYVPAPTIEVAGETSTNNGLGSGTITCSLTDATIYYTLDGSEPTTSTTTYGTSPISLIDVPVGTTIKAMAHVDETGYHDSPVTSFVYIPNDGENPSSGGVFGNVVLLNDREDHTWSYYSDGDQPIHSLNPADVKITYFGYGDNTMTTTSTDNMPDNSDFNGDVTSDQVAVGPNEAGNQFIYLKTLENDDPEGEGNEYSYTMIPNPFSKRPAASQGSVTPAVTTYNLVTSITSGKRYLIVSAASGSAYALGHSGTTIATDAIAINGSGTTAYISASDVDATSIWTATGSSTYTFANGDYYLYRSSGGGGNSTLSISTSSTGWTWNGTSNYLYYRRSGGGGGSNDSYYIRYYNNTFSLSTTTNSVYLFEETTTGGEVTGGDYRGFYAWRVKSLSSGLSITDGSNTYGVGAIIPAETQIQFVTANAEGNEVEFEALWAKAYVVTTNTATGLNADVSYERNFVVGASPSSPLSVPVTYSSYMPDGTSVTTNNVTLSEFTCEADTKFEYIALSGSNTITANNYYLCFGRGISASNTVAGTVQGSSGSVSTNLDYTIRIESGQYEQLLFVGSGTSSGTVHANIILGCDYDRADNQNEDRLTIGTTTEPVYFGGGTLGSSNKNRRTLDCVVKSGKYCTNYWASNNTNDHSYTFYCGKSGGGTYNGNRYVTIEGGHFGGLNGGYGAGSDQADQTDLVFNLRVKGGSFEGSIYGAAAANPSYGCRKMVFTGGTIKGWIAGGCNGTSSGAGATFGDFSCYIGGNAIIGGTSPSQNNGTEGGNVFGSGRGNSGHGDSSNPGSVINAYIVVADNADILNNVYGGGEYCYTTNSTNIYVLGGIVKGSVHGGANRNSTNIPTANIYVNGGKVVGSVYGGSNNSGTVETSSVSMSGGETTNVFGGGLGNSTVISGNTTVTVSGGTINNNVYGGGALGTVEGNTTVSVSGGTMNDVFGAGMGSSSSTANIGGTTAVAISGGTIAESVYGGGENGNVKQPSNPSAKGEEGLMADPSLVSTVDITGGTISGNVFGGGSMGYTNGGTLVTMNGGTVEGSVFGGAFGTQGKVYVAGLRVVNMLAGTVNKNVYGGSRNADDALTFSPDSFASSTETGTASVVNFAGGFVHYQVFASGYFGNVFGSTYAFVGAQAILNAPNHVYDNTTENLNYFNAHQALRIGGSVWAGGDFGNYDGTKFGDPTITGRSNVYIDGVGYDTETNNTTSTNYMNIGGSIYGSGTSCDAGKQGRHIIVNNYGSVIEASQPTAALPYSSATRALYSIQRADNLDIVNSHIVFVGEGKVNSLVTTEKYSIHEFQNVRISNGSSIFMNYPADQIKKFGSYKVTGIYDDAPTYTPVTYESSSLQETPNKVRVNNGAYIQIKYVNPTTNAAEYGELEGFAYMMSDDANNTCAYARPKQSTDSGNTIPSNYDNPNDGGWVSYDATLNTYNSEGGTVGAGSVQMPYENHTLSSKNGEDYFRIWRAGGTLSYREGVFVAQSDGTTNYSTVDVTINLPAFENCDEGTAYYRLQSSDGNTTISYGSDVMTVNAACYGTTGSSEWMYIDGTGANANFVTEVDSTNATLKENGLKYIKDNPNVNFGLVAIPGGGLEGGDNDNMLICEASDPKIATMRWANTHNELMPEVTFRLTYNNNLTNNVVWDPIHLTFEQVGCDGVTVLATVDVALTVTTLTNIEQDFVTQAYAVARGTGTYSESYTAKVVLPQYVMHVNETGEISEWTCKSVTFEPEPNYTSDLFVEGTNYVNSDPSTCNNKFGMTLVAGLNYDNTTGWDSYEVTPQDMYNWNNPDYVFGSTTARDPIGFDFTLLYDGRQHATGNNKVGTLTFVMNFTNYEGAGLEPYEKELTIKIEVWFLGEGSNYYIDGVNGNNLYTGEYPNAAKKTLSGIFNRTGYRAGDNIFVVNQVTATGSNTLSWNGKAYDQVTLYRYPGRHVCVPNETGAESHYVDYDIENNPCYNGPLVVVESNMEMTGIVLDGFYAESQKDEGTAVGDHEGHNHNYTPSEAPLVQIAEGGSLTVYGKSRMENNYNSTTDGGGVYIANGGVLNLYDGSSVINNYVSTDNNGGGIYVNSTSVVQLSDEVHITGNQQIASSSSKDATGTDNNVYLSTYDSHVNVGTVDTGDPYTMLLSTSEVGITKNPDWGNYWYAPVAFSDGGQAYLGNLIGDGIISDDQHKYDLVSLNTTHFSNPLNYLYFVGTWVTEVTEEPEGYNADEIDTPQELAWAISVASGYNGQEANQNASFKLTGDIDMNANIWVPIGSNGKTFNGTFNGNGHVVTGLRSPMNQENMGMFGATGEDANISNLVAQANFAGGSMKNLGTVIGSMTGGTLSNVEAAGTLVGGSNTENMGGLVGTVTNGGTIHSSFAVNDMTGATNTVMGGLVGTNGGNLYNSYANVTMSGATQMGGLVGQNGGTIENCYVVLPSDFEAPAFVYDNEGTISYCYTAKAEEGATLTYVKTSNEGSTLENHGTYDAVADRKEIGYMYNDNLVEATGNTYANHEKHEYLNNHAVVWNGLLSVMNQWVAGHEGYTPWLRPTTGDINGDLPVLGFPNDNSLATEDGKFLHYGSNVDANGLDNLFKTFADKNANIFLYGNATDVTGSNGSNNLFINEDAVLLQKETRDMASITATVGITFDNSSKSAKDYFGNNLNYDWHLMSTPLANAPMGMTYGSQAGYGTGANITGMTGNYMPNGLLDQSEVTWDLYTYYEPQYHWINFKRGSNSHWHYDEPHNPIAYDNEETFTPGKGYMMAISQDSYLSNTGKLNNGDVTIAITCSGTEQGTPTKDWGSNLVGNPYQAYLDLAKVSQENGFGGGYGSSDGFYIYNADDGAYGPYMTGASVNPAVPSQYIHPHQGFFVVTQTAKTLTFKYDMATTSANETSYFRDEEQPRYPVVNLFVEDEAGSRDLAIIELNRPEIGGVRKINNLRNANFRIAARYDHQSYGLMFTPEGTDKVPVRFETTEDGTYTLRWSMYNGDFTSLRLVDNLTGTNYDMLANDHYTFEAKADDYASRFYITYTVTDLEEYNDAEGGFAWFDGSEWVVEGQGMLEVIDVTGRTVYSTRLSGESNRVNLNGVAAGVYVMRIANGQQATTQKIVVR